MTLKYVPFFFRSERFQWLDAKKAQVRQTQDLENLMRHSRETVPYYRNIPDKFSEIPLTPKLDLQKRVEEFKSRQASNQGVWRSTSGSSGKFIKIFWDQDNLFSRFIFMYRAFSMIGYTPLKRVMYGLPDREEGAGFLGLFRNEHFSLRDSVSQNIDQIIKFNPHVLSIYPSYCVELAQKLGERRIPALEAVSLNSEMTLGWQRDVIEKRLGCPTFEEYSTVESGVIAAMCEHRRMHVFTDNIVLEIVDENGSPVQNGEAGDIVISTLTNFSMPLLRYRIGDRGRMLPNFKCPCGRSLPVLDQLLGRSDDFLYGMHEKVPAWKLYEAIERPGESSLCFKDIYLEQNKNKDVKFFYVPANHLSENIVDLVLENLSVLLGSNIRIDTEMVSEIPRPDSAKRKYIYRKDK